MFLPSKMYPAIGKAVTKHSNRYPLVTFVAVAIAVLATVSQPVLAAVPFDADTLAERLQIVPRDGSLRYGESDVEINALGFTLAVRRCYSSLNEAAGAFGRGWATVFDRRLDMTRPNRPILHDEWGDETLFYSRGGLRFLSETGRPQWLTRTDDGFVLRDPHGRFWTFGKEGRPTGILNAEMSGLKIEYSGGRLARVSDPYGRFIRFTTDADGHVVTARSSAGDSRRYEYAKGFLSRVLDGETVLSEFTYGPQGRLITIVEGESRRAAVRYDGRGRVTHLAGPAVADRRVRYLERTVPFRALLVEIEDTDGNVTRYRYREGRPECQITLPSGKTATVDYSDRNLPERIDLPGGSRIEFAYDREGNLTRLVAPGGAFCNFDYGNRGTLTQWTRADGTAFRFEREPSGRLRKIRGPTSNHLWRFSYDPSGRVERFAEEGNRALLIRRNASGDITNVSGEDGEESIVFDLDESGRIGRIAPSGRPAYQFVYGKRGRPEAMTDSVGYRLAVERDAQGRIAAIEDAAGFQDRFVRDETGRPVKWRRAGGAEAGFEGDAEGRLVRVRMPEGNDCRIAHGPEDGSMSETWLGTTRHIERDEFGRVVLHRNARGQTFRLEYDPLGRPVSLLLGGRLAARFQYGLDGRLIHIEGREQELRIGTDSRGRFARLADPRMEQSATYTFSGSGRVKSLATPGGDELRDYDEGGRIVRQVLVGDNPFEIRYRYENDRSRLPGDVHLPGGTSFAYTYDRYGRPSSVKAYLPKGRLVFEESYEYDGRGNVSAIRRGGRKIEFKYDGANRLVEQRLNDRIYARLEYGRDGRLLKIESEEGSLEIVYNRQGQPVRTSRARFGYDPDGNRIRRSDEEGETTCAFDAAGRLIGVTLPWGAAISRRYSPTGRELARSGNRETIERFFLGDRPLHAQGRGPYRVRWSAIEPLWGRVLGQHGGRETELAFRDGRGRLRAVSDGSDEPPIELSWGLLGRIPARGRRPLSDALKLAALEFDPDTGLSGRYDPDSGLSLTPRTLREGLAPYAGMRGRPAEPAWAAAAAGETALIESLVSSGAGGRYAADEGSVLRYLLSSFESSSWPANGSADTFDVVLEGRSFRTPSAIVRDITETVLRDGTGGLTPLLFAPHTELPPSLIGIGRARAICPTLSTLPPVILESDVIDSTVWRDDPLFAASDDAMHGWIGRLVSRACDRSRFRIGEDGSMRLLGELLALSRWSLYLGKPGESAGDSGDEALPTTLDEDGKPPPPPRPGEGILVFVTTTGTEYHRAGCRRLRGSIVPMSLSEARQRGYTACTRCVPPH